MIINNKVYDCTDFMDYHPGGPEYMMQAAGKNGTELFSNFFILILFNFRSLS